MRTLKAARRNLVLIAGLTMMVLIALSTAAIRPILKKRLQWRAQLNAVQQRLVEFDAAYTNQTLMELIQTEKQTAQLLNQAWERLRDQLDTFRQGSPLDKALLPSTHEGRIDFKVALFNARTDLQKLAEEKAIQIPQDLGMAETLDTHENAESRLWQLASLVKLVKQSIEIEVPEIKSVQPSPPLIRHLPESKEWVFREFPVEIQMACSFDQALAFLDRPMEPGQYFILRRFEMENRSRVPEEPLHISAVYSGMPLGPSLTNLYRVAHPPTQDEQP